MARLTNALRRRKLLRRAVLAPVRAFVAGDCDDGASSPTEESLALAVLRSLGGVRPVETHLAQAVNLAIVHGAENIMYLDLKRSPEVNADLTGWLGRRHRASVLHHHRSLLSLKRVGAILSDAGVPWLTMKGPALAEIFYRRPDVRRYADVDILIAPDAFPTAIAALEQRDGQLLDRNWRKVLLERRGELNVRLDTGINVDAHWHVVDRGGKRDEFAISTDDLLARRVRERIGSLFVPTLSPTDALAHVGLHAALDGGGKLSWLLDIAEVARHPALSWPQLVSRLQQWGAQATVGIVLARAAAVVGARIPDHILEELRPSGPLRAVDELLTAALPLWRLDALGHPSLLQPRLARPTTSASMRAASRSAVRWVSRATGRDRRDVFGEQGDRWLRDEYLSRVAAGELDARGRSRPSATPVGGSASSRHG